MPRILSIAGSDPSGGAGIQADIKTISALGGYAMSAITALTVQNSLGVTEVMAVPPELIKAQAKACIDDIGLDGLKLGMLGDETTLKAVAEIIHGSSAFCVIDTVMMAKGGHRLLATEAVNAFKQLILPRADLLTPNIPEAETLCGFEITTEPHRQAAGEALLRMGAKAVLLKGGHGEGEHLSDSLFTGSGVFVFRHPRLETRHTHGTGCTLASACAVLVAKGVGLEAAVGQAIDYVQKAMARAPCFGQGHGPLNHFIY